jgi:hypothetical protein
MAIFDSLGYARFLRDGGVPSEAAETRAGVARRFIMDDLATRTDLQQALDTQSLRITVRVGAMLAGGFGITTAIIGQLTR